MDVEKADPPTDPTASVNTSSDEFVDVDEPSSPSADDDVTLPDPSGEDEVEPSDEWAGVPVDECLSKAASFKAEGNEHFKAQRNAEAHQSYSLGVKCLSHHKEHSEAAALLLSLHLNLAAACLRCELWPEAQTNASKVLAIEADNSKALFRRGVARARLSLLDDAKADLTAACRVDPKNREARAELSAVTERITKRKADEKKAMQGLFSSGGKGLYHDEERKRQAKLAEEKRAAKQKAEEEALKEAALRKEWEAECERLRALQPAEEAMEVDAGAEPAKTDDAKTEDAMEVGEGEEEKPAGTEVVDKPPISFEDFKKAKEEKEKQEREAREAEEKKQKQLEEEARHRARAKADVVKVDDDEELKGFVKGYKKRADGSTTSYFTREVDPETKAMLDQLKQPKRISVTPADEPPPTARSGSAWNKAGTWEEKDCSTWAIDTLKAGVKGVVATSASDASSMGAMLERMKESNLQGDSDNRGLLDLASEISSEIATATVRITEVKNVEGTAAVRASRGTTKHVYDLSFQAEFEVTLEQVEPKEGSAAKKPPKTKGTLHYTDVCPSSEGPKAEVTHKLKKSPPDEYAKRVNASVAELKEQIMQYLRKFDSEFKQKTI